MIVDATAALNQVVQLMLTTLVVEVVQLRGNDAALLRNVGFAQDLGHVEVNEGGVFVVDHGWSALGVGQSRTGGEEGGKTED